MSGVQLKATEQAVQLWGDLANITFKRVGSGTTGNSAYSNNASILFGNFTTGSSYAHAYHPHPSGTGSSYAQGDAWFNAPRVSRSGFGIGRYGYLTILHELGHAIGLEHPGSYNATPGVSITYNTHAEYIQDTRQYTLMSYFSASHSGANHGSTYGATPLLHDIAAIQRLYGANLATRTGNTTYGFNSTAGRDAYKLTNSTDKRIFAIWDAGGYDTLDLSGYKTNSIIDLRPGEFSSAGGLTKNIAIMSDDYAKGKDVFIERAIGGSGNDTLRGNKKDNELVGNGGTDTVILSGSKSQYSVTKVNSTTYRVKDNVSGRDGTDTLKSVEYVSFGSSNTKYALSSLVGGTPKPDYQISALSTGTVVAGQSFIASLTLKNAGNAAFSGGSGVYTAFYLSKDGTLDSGDKHIGSGYNNYSLSPGGSQAFRFGLAAPSDVSGYSYLIAKADAGNSIAESNEGNNTRAFRLTVAKPAQADYQVSYLSVGTVRAGQYASIRYTVRNAGNASGGRTSYTMFYLSKDGTLGSGDVYVGRDYNYAQGAGSSRGYSHSFRAPSNVGSYGYLIARTDGYNQVGESSEGNNTRAYRLPIARNIATGQWANSLASDALVPGGDGQFASVGGLSGVNQAKKETPSIVAYS